MGRKIVGKAGNSGENGELNAARGSGAGIASDGAGGQDYGRRYMASVATTSMNSFRYGGSPNYVPNSQFYFTTPSRLAS